jgi:hypothetical protein
MHPVRGFTSRFMLFSCLVLLCIGGLANAGSLEAQQKGLDVILEFADRLCTTIPLTGGANTLELSGKAKAELSALLKKIANLGIEGAAKYQTLDWQGVLQHELAEQLNNSRHCKVEVFRALKDKLLASVSSDPPSSPAITIHGMWRDPAWGILSQITQQRDTFRYTAWGPSCIGGNFQSSGSGTINGKVVESRYEARLQSTMRSEGRCSGTVSPDGMQMTSTCYDSVCGQFTSSAVRQ